MALVVSEITTSVVSTGYACIAASKQQLSVNFAPRLSVKQFNKSNIAVKAQSGQNGSGAWEESGSEALYVPRICTLREFSDSNGGSEVAVVRADKERSMAEILLACVEASAQVSDFETLSGRLAMIGFASALSVEFVTGNSVFSGMDVEGLANVIALCVVATGVAAGFALGWRSKRHVSDVLATGCKRLMDSAVDSMIDGLFFEDGRGLQWQEKGIDSVRK